MSWVPTSSLFEIGDLIKTPTRWLPKYSLVKAGGLINIPSGSTPPPVNTLLIDLLAYWNLNETSGNRLDSSGNGYDLTDSGGVGYETGLIDNAALFDVNLELTTNVISISALTSGTISLWVKTTDLLPAEAAMIPIAYQFPDIVAVIAADFSAVLTYYWYQNGTNLGNLTNSPLLESTDWVLMTLTWEDLIGTTTYVNGELHSFDYYFPSYSGSDNLLELNYYSDGRGLIGAIDEMGIWTRALTLSEVAELYNLGSGKTYPFT